MTDISQLITSNSLLCVSVCIQKLMSISIARDIPSVRVHNDMGIAIAQHLENSRVSYRFLMQTVNVVH